MSNILYISQPLSQISGASFILLHLFYCTDTDHTKIRKKINDNLQTFIDPGNGMRNLKQIPGKDGQTNYRRYLWLKTCVKNLSVYSIFNPLGSWHWTFLVGSCNVHAVTLQSEILFSLNPSLCATCYDTHCPFIDTPVSFKWPVEEDFLKCNSQF
jgi:hypothetical protein